MKSSILKTLTTAVSMVLLAVMLSTPAWGFQISVTLVDADTHEILKNSVVIDDESGDYNLYENKISLGTGPIYPNYTVTESLYTANLYGPNTMTSGSASVSNNTGRNIEAHVFVSEQNFTPQASTSMITGRGQWLQTSKADDFIEMRWYNDPSGSMHPGTKVDADDQTFSTYADIQNYLTAHNGQLLHTRRFTAHGSQEEFRTDPPLSFDNMKDKIPFSMVLYFNLKLSNNSGLLNRGQQIEKNLCPGVIGDFVWHDLNRDGIQGLSEPGINDVKLNLKYGNDIIATTTTITKPGTSQLGYYQFSNICPDEYTVELDTTTVPSGLSSTTVNATGSTTANDSNPNPATVVLTLANPSDQTIDFGFITPVVSCGLLVDKKCALPPPPPSTSYVCTKPIDSLSMKWNGTSGWNSAGNNIRIKAWKGLAGSTLLADIDNIVIGQTVTVTGYPGAPNDVRWEVFKAGTLEKLGESDFHISCSDVDMNSADDCFKREGDAKGLVTTPPLLNDWIFMGMSGGGVSLICEAPAPTFNDGCALPATVPPGCATLGKPTSLTFKYVPAGCYTNNNNKQNGKYTCTGTTPGSPATITSTTAGLTITPATVNTGEDFTVSGSFGADTKFTIGGTQTMNIHTSCSQLLEVGNTFDSLTLVGFNGKTAGNEVIFQYTVNNTGDALKDVMLSDNVLGPIAGPLNMPKDSMLVFTKNGIVETLTTNTATATGTFVSEVGTCTANDSVTVTVEPVYPTCNIAVGTIKFDKNKVSVILTNNGTATATLSSIHFDDWPAVNGKLKKVKRGADIVWDGADIPTPPATLTGLKKNTINAGSSITLTFEFDKDPVSTNAAEYTLSLDFGCIIDVMPPNP